MPDPIDELDNFHIPGPPMNPLPAAEVRRRGNRIRRRNNALATVGALAVVAAIATPFAVAAGGSGQSQQDIGPADQPRGGWVQTIPAGFPLSPGMPAGTEESAGYDQQSTDVCDDQGWAATDESRQAVFTDPSEGGRDRALALYPDDDAAEQAVDDLRTRVEACAAETAGGFPTTESLDASGGEQAYAYVNRYTDGGDADVVRVVRVGNAVLQDSASTQGAGDPAIVQDLLDRLGSDAEGTVAAMCTFSLEGCATETPTGAVDGGAGLTGAIPDDFPVAEGLPSGGTLDGPAHEIDLAPYNLDSTLQACGVRPSGLPAAVDTFYAGHRTPAEGILRQVMTFESAAEAQAYVDGTIAPFAACAEDTSDARVTRVYEVTRPELGDDTAVAAMRTEVDGEPGIGYEFVQLTRVGQAVLLTLVINDAEPFDTDLASSYLLDTEPVVEAMG